MNLTDLTTELEERAGQASSDRPGPATGRLTGVRRRIRERRRRQVTAAVGLVAAGVAAIVLVPNVSGLRADQNRQPAITDSPNPTPSPTDSTAEPVSGPLHFPADGVLNSLIGSAVGRPGQAELVLRFTPEDLNLGVTSFCRLVGAPPPALAEVTSETTVNGHPFTQSDCDDEAEAVGDHSWIQDEEATVNRSHWAGRGVVVGQESEIRIRLIRKTPASQVPPTLRLGIGIYNVSGRLVLSNGVTLKTKIAAGDHRYYLDKHKTLRATSGRRNLKITVEAGTNIGMVLVGNPNDSSKAGGRARLFVDGVERADVAAGGTVSKPVEDTDAHTLELRLDPGLRGTMVIAYYVDVG